MLDDQLFKYNAKGDLLTTYSNKYLGKISMVDASNPLRTLLFYQDFGQLVFLDDMLALIGAPIVLEELGLDQAMLACTSVNDGIWLYDPRDFKLTRMDRSLNITHQVYQVNQLVGVFVEPTFLLEQDNILYMNNPATGIMLFDIFGGYIKTIPLNISSEFQVINNQLIYYNNEGWFAYDLTLFKLAQHIIPGSQKDVTSVRIEKGKGLLIVQKETRIELMIIGD